MRSIPLALALVSVLALTACATPPTLTAAPTAAPNEVIEPTAPTVPGYPFGAFPPVPLFTLPDISILDDSRSLFTAEFDLELADIPGLEVAPARCAEGGEYVRSSALTLYGDGSGNVVGPEGTTVNYGDGSGALARGDSQIVLYGDGSGTYDDGVTRIVNYGDGAGVFERGALSVTIHGDGSGTRTDSRATNVNYGDGSGSYTDRDVKIVNYGDGSGSYTDARIEIVNYGDGTGLIDGEPVDLEPIAPIARLGVFPPLGVLEPVEPVCGTLVTLADSVLFDFDKSALRAEADAPLATLATALAAVDAGTVTVTGHTDSIGSDSYNLTLSQRRADAVVAALEARGVATSIQSRGAGESEPIAANEIDRVDNPAGRQLNRRVEIFIAP